MSRKVQLVWPRAVVDLRHLDRVAGVTQVLEPHALHHPPGRDVEARDDPDRKAHVRTSATAEIASSSEGPRVEGGADDGALHSDRGEGGERAQVLDRGDATEATTGASVRAHTLRNSSTFGPCSMPSLLTSVTT
jgi:hypothetical protein